MVMLFNPCAPCCYTPERIYFWFLCTNSGHANQFAFEDCDIWCGPRPEEPGETGHQLRGNLFSGGVWFEMAAGHTQMMNLVSCLNPGVEISGWGWRYQRFGEGPEYEWRLTPWVRTWDFGVASYEYDAYDIGPYVGTGTIEDLIVREDEDGNLTGGIWLDNEKAGQSCAHNVPDRLLIIDEASASDYLTVSGIGPLVP